MRMATPLCCTNASRICCALLPCSASATTRRCIAGLVPQVKSVVRQVYTSRLQPQVQWICFSIAWMAASLSAARTGSKGLPARDGSHNLPRSEEHTSELQSRLHLVCRLLLEKKKKTKT